MKATTLKPAKYFKADPARGFTLLELLVVIAVIAILASVLLPTLAKSKARAQAIFCGNNTRQLTMAWLMYADEHDGRLAYNLGSSGPGMVAFGSSVAMSNNWANNVLDWDVNNSDNTNAAKLAETGLGPYASKSANIYRCPSDYALSSSQQGAGWRTRVRSYSMNAMIGDAGSFTRWGYNENNPDYLQFFKLTAVPRPADIFVFLDEHPDSISDGYFVNKAYKAEWIRLPASYHDRAASFSFVDGHVEVHRWRYSRTCPPPLPYQAKLPIQVPADEMADFKWVTSRMSFEQD